MNVSIARVFLVLLVIGIGGFLLSTTGVFRESYSIHIENAETKWWHGAAFYQIFPRSFKDSDNDGSGDLNGITEKLDYLKELNVDAIWLTPIFTAEAYHGYDTVDYYSIAEDFGSMEDFDVFMEKSDSKEIRVILDLVLNHVSDQHPWFIKSANREPGYEDFFVWSDTQKEGWGNAWGTEPHPDWVWFWNEQRQQFFYSVFGPGMPDLNLANPRVVEELKKVASFWLDKGVDGFRLDAVRYMIEEGPLRLQADTDSTIKFWEEISTHVKSVNPDAFLIGEAWADQKTISKYYNDGKALDAVFDFDFGYLVKNYLSQNASQSADFGSAINIGRSTSVKNLWRNLKSRNQSTPLYFYSPFLGNHDKPRTAHELGNDSRLLKLAASLLLTNPGPVFIYYGEEVGLTQSHKGAAAYQRSLMQWDESENAGFNDEGPVWLNELERFVSHPDLKIWWPEFWENQKQRGAHIAGHRSNSESLWHHYKKLLDIRATSPAIRAPEFLKFYPQGSDKVWLIEYRKGENQAWVVINFDLENPANIVTPNEMNGVRVNLFANKTENIREAYTLLPGAIAVF